MLETTDLCCRQTHLTQYRNVKSYSVGLLAFSGCSTLIYLFSSDTLQAEPPDPSKIREEDIMGVTVLLLTCSYMGQEFIRVGYYVNNEYDDEQLKEEPPQKVLIDRVQRNILSDKPRVTKFPINFHPENKDPGDQHPRPDLPGETDLNREE